MAFEQQEVADFANALPQGAFDGAAKSEIQEWCSFLVGVDPTPKAKHDLFW